MSTPQYEAIVKCTSKLLSAFKSDLIGISAELVSESLISPALLEEVSNIQLPMDYRACSLVRAVTEKVEASASNYDKLVKILSKDGELNREVLAELQETLEQFESKLKLY